MPPDHYGAPPYGLPAPDAAREEPHRRAGRSSFRSQLADDLRQAPRTMWVDFQAALLDLLANVAVAAVVVGVFSLVGYAIGGSTGALLAGLVGVGVFFVLRLVVYAGLFVWGLGWMVKRARRPR
ncbi:hypothetical protein [Sanguibacter sp. 25GB23B1]|uniref:hypothetical protein n=1 Tax=Sanguibacter sp. 25GB23B1 TaxID=3156067 RepID=UPI0032AF5783